MMYCKSFIKVGRNIIVSFVKRGKAIYRSLTFYVFRRLVDEFVVQGLQENESAGTVSLRAYLLALSSAELTVTGIVSFEMLYVSLMRQL
jgi:hypothetical protein